MTGVAVMMGVCVAAQVVAAVTTTTSLVVGAGHPPDDSQLTGGGPRAAATEMLVFWKLVSAMTTTAGKTGPLLASRWRTYRPNGTPRLAAVNFIFSA